MKKLIRLPIPPNVQTAITCPAGMEIRFVMVNAITSPDPTGDQFSFVFLLDNVVVFNAGSPASPGTTSVFSGGIGCAPTHPAILSFNPATGVNTFIAASVAQFSLPDVWWNDDFVVLAGMETGSVTSVWAAYEMRPIRGIPNPRPLTSRPRSARVRVPRA